MEHREYRSLAAGADTAVLFVHGIVGTPRHFDGLIALLPRTVSVHNLLLAGHGAAARDFGRASMELWEAQVEQAVASLAEGHENIYIVAHSMGALLAIEAAVRHEKVRKLFLLAVPLGICLRAAMVRNSWKVFRGNIRSDDHAALAAQRCCGVAQTRNPLHYLGWIPRFLELFAKIRAVRALLPRLTVPCCAVQSMEDELVSYRAAEELGRNPWVTVVELMQSGHYYYPDDDLALLQKRFCEFMAL